MTHGRKELIGLDLQGNEMAAVKAVIRRGNIEFSAAHPSDLRGFCAGTLSPRESITRWLEAPFSSRSKALKVLPAILDVDLPFPLEECTYAFVGFAAGSDGKFKALAVAARNVDIAAKLNAFRGRGADPAILDNEGVALWTESLREMPPKHKEAAAARAVVYAGKDRMTLAIGLGSAFISAHAVRDGGAEHIGRLLRAALGGSHTRVQWHWAGPGALNRKTVDDCLAGIGKDWAGPSVIHKNPELFLARAVAARALMEKPMWHNLRGGDMTHAAIETYARRRNARAASAILAAGVALIAANIGISVAMQSKVAETEQEFNRLANDLSGNLVQGARGSDAIEIARRHCASETEKLRPFIRVFEPSFSSVLEKIALAGSASGVKFESLTLGTEGLSLKGSADNWNACDSLLARLKGMGYNLKLDRKEDIVGERVAFTLQPEGQDK